MQCSNSNHAAQRRVENFSDSLIQIRRSMMCEKCNFKEVPMPCHWDITWKHLRIRQDSLTFLSYTSNKMSGYCCRTFLWNLTLKYVRRREEQELARPDFE